MSLMRELPLLPDAPLDIRHDKTLRHVVTELAFGDTHIRLTATPDSIDTVFCFGSNEGHQRQGKSLCALFNRNVSIGQLILTSGMDWKVHNDVPDLGEPISVATLRAMEMLVPAQTKIGMDTLSNNTKENAVRGWSAMPRAPKGVIAISALAFHIGRCQRTLQVEIDKHGWSGSILYAPYQALENAGGKTIEITAEDWWEHDIAASRIWGEVTRIHKYGSRGDIAFMPGDATRFGLLRGAGLDFSG